MIKRNRFLSLTFALATFIFSASAICATVSEVPPGHWRPDFWRFTAFSEYFSSKANLGSSGTKSYTALDPGNSVQIYEVRPKLRYNLSDKFSIYFGGGLIDAGSITGSIVRNNSSVSEVFAGIDYILSGQYSRLVGELEGSFATTPYSETNTNTLLSDGADFIRAQVYFFRPYSFGNPFVHVGAQLRDQGFSQLALYGGGFERPLGQSFLIGAGVEGEQSIISDINNPIFRTALTDQVMGGSHYFAAYNPSFVEGRAWAGYKPEAGWQLKLGFAQTFLGTNAAYGQSIFLSFSINFDPRADAEGFSHFRQSKSSARRKGQKDLNEFEPDPEKVDTNLFKDEQRFEPLD